MYINVVLNSHSLFSVPSTSAVEEIKINVAEVLGIQPHDFYLLQNGKNAEDFTSNADVHVFLRLVGGKGGFGSMLRAIGAQIEKTTNREACRDLSGRRLRDINEEKRLKTWLDGQKEREQEAEEKRKKKIQKLQSKPKHEFKDDAYEQSRTDLTQNISDSLEEGFKKAAAAAAATTSTTTTTSTATSVTVAVGDKRKSDTNDAKKKKKKRKTTLWLGDDISSSSDTDSESDSGCESSKKSVSSKESTKATKGSSTATTSAATSDESSIDK